MQIARDKLHSDAQFLAIASELKVLTHDSQRSDQEQAILTLENPFPWMPTPYLARRIRWEFKLQSSILRLQFLEFLFGFYEAVKFKYVK